MNRDTIDRMERDIDESIRLLSFHFPTYKPL